MAGSAAATVAAAGVDRREIRARCDGLSADPDDRRLAIHGMLSNRAAGSLLLLLMMMVRVNVLSITSVRLRHGDGTRRDQGEQAKQPQNCPGTDHSATIIGIAGRCPAAQSIGRGESAKAAPVDDPIGNAVERLSLVQPFIGELSHEDHRPD